MTLRHVGSKASVSFVSLASVYFCCRFNFLFHMRLAPLALLTHARAHTHTLKWGKGAFGSIPLQIPEYFGASEPMTRVLSGSRPARPCDPHLPLVVLNF